MQSFKQIAKLVLQNEAKLKKVANAIEQKFTNATVQTQKIISELGEKLFAEDNLRVQWFASNFSLLVTQNNETMREVETLHTFIADEVLRMNSSAKSFSGDLSVQFTEFWNQTRTDMAEIRNALATQQQQAFFLLVAVLAVAALQLLFLISGLICSICYCCRKCGSNEAEFADVSMTSAKRMSSTKQNVQQSAQSKQSKKRKTSTNLQPDEEVEMAGEIESDAAGGEEAETET